MGVIHTESFQRFSRMNTGAETPQAGAAVFYEEYTESRLSRFGTPPINFGTNLAMTRPWASASGNVDYFVASNNIIQDPIVPRKNRLSTPIIVRPGNVRLAGTQLQIPVASDHFIVGFLFRGEGSAGSTPRTAATLSIGGDAYRMQGGQVTSATATADFLTRHFPSSALFSATVTPSTDISYGFSTAEMSVDRVKRMVTFEDYFLEFEVNRSSGMYRVWIDDFLVFDGALPAGAFPSNVLTVSFATASIAGSASIAFNIRTMISDLYVVDCTDGIDPVNRLGPSTRVAGFSPEQDVSVMFSRPAGFNSNSEVVGRPINSTNMPADYLSGEDVGTTDLYSSPSNDVGAEASIVYAVNIKTQFANGSSSSHELGGVLSNGVDETSSGYGVTPPASGLLSKSVIFHDAPGGEPLTPENIGDLDFGVKILS